MSIRKSFILASVFLGMSIITASANAVTGLVSWYFTQDYSDGQVYTFVNIDTGNICYYIGQNTSYASIFAASQIAGDPVTVSCDSAYKITSVAN